MNRSPLKGRRPARERRGFTLTELLTVILILSLLIALLLPVINGALRTARNAAVSAEINQLAQALANFKSKYGEFPPSRIYLCEDGNYVNVGSTTPVSSINGKGAGDITLGLLAQRSLAALRKYFPRINLSTAGATGSATTFWYDFNGNGVFDTNHYILSGHECLVFFLGGIPLNDGSGNIAMTGFGKDPTNPFTNSVNNSNIMYSANRQPPLFEFNTSRLFLDPNNLSMNGVNPGNPGYYDSLGNSPPLVAQQTPTNFYAYFSAYGSNNYDPNDVNFPEADSTGALPTELYYTVNFPVVGSKGAVLSGQAVESEGPNPYTNTLTIPASGTVTYVNPQSFQIMSPGIDGLYGVGGQYVANTSTGASNPLPFDATNTYSNGSLCTDSQLRVREQDNLTNVKNGTLR
jgi:prepilin-type N-terminal cleavage/methylation domain-containing protein